MADSEKVIKGLEILMNGCEYIHCDDCCFYISAKPVRCGLREEQIQEDALALLKEQEAVKPVKEQFFSSIFGWVCGACGFPLLSDGYMYCPWCGKQVKWNEP